MLPWNEIDTVLLDMDGTLLDLRFDNHFWLERIPEQYARLHGIDVVTAKSEFLRRADAVTGTLKWYCVDHWTQELGLDIPALKREVKHMIRVHPHVKEFLGALRAAGKRTALVTNAHGKSLSLKMERTGLDACLDAIVCAHDLGLPKEDDMFWQRLGGHMYFDPASTLLVDDTIAVLKSAQRFGLRFLVAVLRPDSTVAPRNPGEFMAIEDFSELMPGL